MARSLLASLVFMLAPAALAAQGDSEQRKVAEQYLNALTGAGDESGKELLLGGATMNAQLFSLENWRIVSKDPVEREEGDLGRAVQMIHELDRAGRQALTQLLGAAQGSDGLELTQISQAEAARLMAPTREKAERLLATYPVLAYVARVGKEVYWHPKNPLRSLLARAGKSGKYTLELHRWQIESREGPRKVPRVWPLRVLRFKSAKVDTGWKVLPASDWNAE